MAKWFKQIRADVLMSSILTILLGVFLIIEADATLVVVCKAIAFACILGGIMVALGALMSGLKWPFPLMGGGLLLLLGIWFWVRPDILAGMVPTAVGVVLIVHGIVAAQMAFQTRRYRYNGWWISFVTAIVTAVVGVFIIVYAFRVASVAVQALGVALIYSGIANLLVVGRVSRAARNFKNAVHREDDVIDVDGKEV